MITYLFYCLPVHRNLFPCSESGTDSYVRMYLLPDQTWRHRKKTHVKKNTVNPVYSEKSAHLNHLLLNLRKYLCIKVVDVEICLALQV